MWEFREMQIVRHAMNLAADGLVHCWSGTVYAISVLRFIGSICALDKATIKDENHALQCTTAGPYNAITSKLLNVGSVCGLGPDLAGIHSISFAARYRVAACSSTLRRGLEQVSTARGHSCTPFCSLSLAWEQ